MTTDSPEDTTPAEAPEKEKAEAATVPKKAAKKAARKSAAKKAARAAKVPKSKALAKEPKVEAEKVEKQPVEVSPETPPETGDDEVKEVAAKEQPAKVDQEATEVAAKKQPEDAEPEPEPKPLPPVPDFCDINELHKRPLSELHKMAVEAELRVAGIRSKHQLLFEILSYYARRGTRIEGEGVLEYDGGGYGNIRWERYSFAPLPDDIYVHNSVIRRHNLRPGLKLRCNIRTPREKDKFFSADEVLTIEGIPIKDWVTPKKFDDLTALFPKDRIILETKKDASISSRIVDLVAPLGKGQRGLINAPPRGGKTLLLKDIASSISKNYPEIELLVLLLDERPEEVTDFTETVNVQVYSSTFDENPKRHIQVAELVSERARRLVELGKDVVILLDSLTRLARGYNQIQGGGRIGSGGIGTKALIKPRKFFGSARNVEEGGSLTIIATALIETENRMDEVIFEEFKGTGNMEISLDREMVEKRIFPALHILKSGTRNDDKLYHPEEFKRIAIMRRELSQLPAVEAVEVLMRNLRASGSNAEFLMKGLK